MLRPVVPALLLALLACAAPTDLPPEDLGTDPREWGWADLGVSCPADAPAVPLSAERRDSILEIDPDGNTDERYADFSLRNPGGFAGWYHDNVTGFVLLVDTTALQDVVAALDAEGFGVSLRVPTSVARQARWDYVQLRDWYRYLQPKLAPARFGMRMTDLDATRNRLAFGVDDTSKFAIVDAELRALGVPCHLVARGVQPPVIW